MKSIAIIGGQWGDEGKGKLTDYFAQKADLVIRWTGGDNAGHTIEFDNKQFKLSIIPSGVFNNASLSVIAAGCVVNLKKLVFEIEYLQSNNIDCDNLCISSRCHVIFPYHLFQDQAEEAYRQQNQISTTKRGIGPAFQDKASRDGIRLDDFFDLKKLRTKIKDKVTFKNNLLSKVYGFHKTLDPERVYAEAVTLFEQIKDYVCDTSLLIRQAYKKEQRIVFEGAQGSMLDLQFGTYPFVTSSRPIGSSIACETGIGPNMIDHKIGVFKAYTSRVGAGDLVATLPHDIASVVREKAHEFGTVTHRERDLGYFDVVAARHAVEINGLESIAITLLDILQYLPEIKIVTHYLLNGKKINYMPTSITAWNQCQPVFETMPSWKKEISHIRRFQDLPDLAQKYVKRLCTLLDCDWSVISVGPSREALILNPIYFS